MDPGLGEGSGIQRVDRGERLEVLVDDRVAGISAEPRKVRTPGNGVAHERRELLDPSVDLRNRNAGAMEQILELHLVTKREVELGVDPVSANEQVELVGGGCHVDEPVRSPARLRGYGFDRSSQLRPHPRSDRRLGLDRRVLCSVSVHGLPNLRRLDCLINCSRGLAAGAKGHRPDRHSPSNNS